MAATLAIMFGVGVLLNVIWEFAHCQLYETCRRQTWRHNVPLLVKMSFKDGFFIVLFYLITAGVFQSANPLQNPRQLSMFLIISFVFAFADEKISTRLGRWQYAPAMPTLFGVGLTPLLEIAATGLATFFLIF